MGAMRAQTSTTRNPMYIDTTQAATRIQRAWRRRQAAKSRPLPMDADSRWKDAAVQARMKIDRLDADKGKNDPRTRWKRAAFLVSRIQDKNTLYSRDSALEETKCQEDKMLETQHWLELVDALDRGAGKDISLDECSREQLDKERIIYLSSEQRMNYLVTIDDQGRLRWARNNVLVDTTEGKWHDLGEGMGIIPQDDPGKYPPIPPRPRDSFGSASSISVGSRRETEATHYTRPPKGRTRFGRAVRRHFTLKGMMDKLLRKTVRKNTWIYVTDKSFNIFIGIKGIVLASGILQAADTGLISVKEGIIYKLSPLSGHYRTSVGHFRKFVEGLSERGVDMSKARISRAEVVLRSIETVSKANRTRRKAVANAKGHVKEAFRGWGDDGEERRPGTSSTRRRKDAGPEKDSAG
ncbi:hypothetical protein M405DRAFT_866004 [Rhizopogon salebrosus TDB-379]|nr:hypothetical protein M405DRAFT_866004 [Rhizopogon salebrosus TDB-379]